MINTLRSTSLVVTACLLATNNAFAERSKAQQAWLESGTFIGTTVAATAAGGPVGFIVGAVSGAFLATQTREANTAKIELKESKGEIDSLTVKMSKQDRQIDSLEAQIVEKLTFQVLFATGDDKLTAEDHNRIKILAYYLQQNPMLKISLDGHTDPRGTDEYNNVLSMERAVAIKQALVEEGIAEGRIQCAGHGTQFSQASKGDYDGYKQERRVEINLWREDKTNFAQATDWETPKRPHFEY